MLDKERNKVEQCLKYKIIPWKTKVSFGDIIAISDHVIYTPQKWDLV